MKFPILIITTLALLGCSSPPDYYQFDNQRTYSKGKDQVWANIMEWLTKNRMQIKTIEKGSGIMYAERTHNLSGHFADCGLINGQPLPPEVGQFNVFVKTVGSKTQVTVNADYALSYRNPYNNSTMRTTCNSRGMLEQMILDAAGGK